MLQANKKKEKVLIIGGAGYVGAQLVLELLKNSYQVTVYDLMIYGNVLPNNHPNLKIIVGDVRDVIKLEKSMKNQDVIIHLACISNDPSFELNPQLGYEINFKYFEPLIISAKKSGIKKFIYASSSSVYGVKDIKEVSEEESLAPLTDYSKFKVKCENVLLSYTDSNFVGAILRPATVCGYSPRQRLDLVVNILTNLAYHKNEITIFGGKQLRPNIHIDDMVSAYICLINSDSEKIKNQIFNVGFENQSVEDLALNVKKNISGKVKLLYKKTDDNRSYHISSKKIFKVLGFSPKKNIDQAIKDLIQAFDKKKLINTFSDENYFNIKKMQKINLN
jgi:nucleoside-diphosphate-sugar epimerase